MAAGRPGGAPAEGLTAGQTEEVRTRVRLLIQITARGGKYRKGLLAAAEHHPCTGCGDPNLLPDSATDVGAVVARVSGFATVSLQMRGTGCSGGAYDLFGYPSDYDAYDAVEIVSHQNWVANHKVGMVGISYSGLSQLPSAGTDPPGLAAIAPMSPTDDLFSTGYPGGIYNNGFAAGIVAAFLVPIIVALRAGFGYREDLDAEANRKA